MSDDDRDLREAFAALRRDEAASAPRFDRLLAAARARTTRRPGRASAWALAGAGALAALVLAVAVWRQVPPPQPPAPARTQLATLAAWRSPTDFLLEVPGQELLATVPSLGRDLPDVTAGTPPPTERSPRP